MSNCKCKEKSFFKDIQNNNISNDELMKKYNFKSKFEMDKQIKRVVTKYNSELPKIKMSKQDKKYFDKVSKVLNQPLKKNKYKSPKSKYR